MNRLNKLKSFVAEEVSTQPKVAWEEAFDGQLPVLKSLNSEILRFHLALL